VTNDSLRKWTAVIVIAGWSLSLIAAIVTKDPVVLGIVTPVMMFVMGFLYGFKPNGNGNNGNNNNGR
jgi:hypothetical protein